MTTQSCAARIDLRTTPMLRSAPSAAQTPQAKVMTTHTTSMTADNPLQAEMPSRIIFFKHDNAIYE